ncbi:MAG: helix-turn-helix domain-containing protein [Cellulomonas sp.]|uniref:helix-turn-helix transcriptional regulator n=1 Tax=Cellulomonas sp. TaxID=40001 RepID=UPI00258DCF5C|nr:helix-turn-helix domain-containing protein [Cellulomonas sp.]MCR6706186.1 helix-turn-helix domain-containing protein [Cellulomonas sp.]
MTFPSSAPRNGHEHGYVRNLAAPQPPQPLFTIKGLAAFLAVGVPTIRDWVAAGTGPTVIRVGGQLRWRPEDVQQWLDAHVVGGETRCAYNLTDRQRDALAVLAHLDEDADWKPGAQTPEETHRTR